MKEFYENKIINLTKNESIDLITSLIIKYVFWLFLSVLVTLSINLFENTSPKQSSILMIMSLWILVFELLLFWVITILIRILNKIKKSK